MNVTWKLSKDRKVLLVTLTVDMVALCSLLMRRHGMGQSDEDGLLNAMTSQLTPRETEMLPYLLKGTAAKEIASKHNISVRTVKYHTSSVYRKMGVSGKAELMHLGILGFANTQGENHEKKNGSHRANGGAAGIVGMPNKRSRPGQRYTERDSGGLSGDHVKADGAKLFSAVERPMDRKQAIS
jgi:DNA-binding CsgD family transcriptional regulator